VRWAQCRSPQAALSQRRARRSRSDDRGPLPRRQAGAPRRVGDADASLSERSSKYRGLELLVRETFPRAGDLTFKPAIRRDNLFRFDQRRGIYVRYATDVRSLN
jgi:hypothetical protein